jgi:2-polyprenyl-6-methoxyphenol hydroxylase-like FAD-dependent oxidoreductase
MSPCGGVGANTALTDAAELARLLAASGDSPLQAADIASYESAMRVRAFKGVMRSYAGSKKMFDQRPFEDCQEARL